MSASRHRSSWRRGAAWTADHHLCEPAAWGRWSARDGSASNQRGLAGAPAEQMRWPNWPGGSGWPRSSTTGRGPAGPQSPADDPAVPCWRGFGAPAARGAPGRVADEYDRAHWGRMLPPAIVGRQAAPRSRSAHVTTAPTRGVVVRLEDRLPCGPWSGLAGELHSPPRTARRPVLVGEGQLLRCRPTCRRVITGRTQGSGAEGVQCRADRHTGLVAACRSGLSPAPALGLGHPALQRCGRPVLQSIGDPADLTDLAVWSAARGTAPATRWSTALARHRAPTTPIEAFAAVPAAPRGALPQPALPKKVEAILEYADLPPLTAACASRIAAAPRRRRVGRHRPRRLVEGQAARH